MIKHSKKKVQRISNINHWENGYCYQDYFVEVVAVDVLVEVVVEASVEVLLLKVVVVVVIVMIYTIVE